MEKFLEKTLPLIFLALGLALFIVSFFVGAGTESVLKIIGILIVLFGFISLKRNIFLYLYNKNKDKDSDDTDIVN